MENFNCCNQTVRGLAAWDDAQLTDHAYNLSMCDKCGVIYKEDVWNDKGLRAIFLDGSMATSSTDAEWEESGLLKNLDGHLKSIVLDYLKLAEVKYAKRDERTFIMLFSLVRQVLQKLFDQPERDRLLKMFDLDILVELGQRTYASGKFDVHADDFHQRSVAEAEMTMYACNKYVSDLLEKVAT